MLGQNESCFPLQSEEGIVQYGVSPVCSVFYAAFFSSWRGTSFFVLFRLIG